MTLKGRSARSCLRSLGEDCWIDQEIAGCEFRDARLGDRFRKLLTQIGGAMGQSIPLVCQDWANTKAAYRFFSKRTFRPAISNRRVSVPPTLAVSFLCCTTQPINAKVQKRSASPRA
nr:transposase [Bradyrhizobium hipponense]